MNNFLKENRPIKLITLNTWGGRSLHQLMRFFREKASETDIFCLQEVFDTDQTIIDERHPDEYVCGTLFKKISAVLKDFEGSFAYFDDNPYRQSLAMFVRRALPVKEISDLIVYNPEKPQEVGSNIFSARKLQYAIIEGPRGKYTICNFHGLWTGGSKKDNDERIAQSYRVREFLDKVNGPTILCGDFNLLPDTESMHILEEGMHNLVKEKNIESTRTTLYRHFDDLEEPNFADYIIASGDIEIHDFKLLPDVVSDHSPLYLEFS